jgi:solute carrier family 25 thiamine pyrophosphate transporter 19
VDTSNNNYSLFQQLRSRKMSPGTIAFSSGALSGIAATLVTYPFDYTRTAYASSLAPTSSTGTSLIRFIGKTVQARGVRGLYAGVGPAVVGIVPLMGINFYVYETLMDSFAKGDGGGGSSANKNLYAGACGAMSGGISKFLVYPVDTIKKRLQAQTFNSLRASAGGGTLTTLTQRGAVQTCKDIVVKEGPLALYRGILPTVVKSSLGTGLTFAFFNSTRGVLVREWERREGLR